MKKLLLLLYAFLIFACTDDEGNPCVYEPTLTTEAATNITETSATLNGVISIVSENCEVAPGEMQGFVYSTNPSPTNDDDVEFVYGTDISTSVEGLEPNTTYYVRAFLTNTIGEFYGNEIDFTTEESSGCNETGTVTDQDGNSYDYLCYGDQVWTVENAEMVAYRDGTPIPEVTDNTEWESLNTGAWAYYNNDPTKHRLYNWFAVMGIHDTDPNTPNKEFAPEGWHVPSDAEWTTLENQLIANGYNYDDTTTENKIAKAMASTTYWNTSTVTGAPGNDQSTNNSSGFNAFPKGYRGYWEQGSFVDNSNQALFWSSTSSNDVLGWYFRLTFQVEFTYLTNDDSIWKQGGMQVRFVRD